VLKGAHASRVKRGVRASCVKGCTLIDISLVIAWAFYAPQTKNLEGRTHIPERLFDALFQRFLPKLSTVTPLKSASKSRSGMHVRPSKFFVWESYICLSNFIPPKRRFWKDEQKMKSGFSNHFSRTWVLFLGYEPLIGLRTIEKSVEKPDFIFCSSFQNLRLGSINLQDDDSMMIPLRCVCRTHKTRWW
jgi:hypothetical protein